MTAAIGEVVVERVGRTDMSMRALATLRMTVFRSWPYLYDGSTDYEAQYLSEFLASDDAILIVARIGEIPVGMATASPMANQPHIISDPFRRSGHDVTAISYFGESVLLPQFRGQGIGHRFFDQREAAARNAGATLAAFCAVDRGESHPARPENVLDLAPFWNGRGYGKVEGLTTIMSWKEVGHVVETDHRMQFWQKRL